MSLSKKRQYVFQHVDEWHERQSFWEMCITSSLLSKQSDLCFTSPVTWAKRAVTSVSIRQFVFLLPSLSRLNWINQSLSMRQKERERKRERGKTSSQKLEVINNMPAATKHCRREFSTCKKAINKEGNLKQMPSEGPSAKCKMRGHPGSFQMSLFLNYMLSALDGYILIFYNKTLPGNGAFHSFSPQEARFANENGYFVHAFCGYSYCFMPFLF